MPYARKTTSFEAGRPDAQQRIVIFHGYTGSPDEFRPLAEALADACDARVFVPLLPGHGTNEADLLGRTYEDFVAFARAYVRDLAADGRPLILMGHSFGGYLAIECAAEAKCAGLILTVVPFNLRPPLSLPGAAWLMRQKLLWDKKVPVQEKIERIGLFYYRHMPGIALTLLKRGIARAKELLGNISAPIFCIHTMNDPLTYAASGTAIIARAPRNAASTASVVPERQHGIFYGEGHDEIVGMIVEFAQTVMRK